MVKRSLDQFSVVLATYASARRAAPIDMPFDPPDGMLEAFQVRL